VKHRVLCRARGFNQKTEKRKQIRSGLRPLRGGRAAAAMVLTAIIDCAKGCLEWCGFGQRLRGRMMARHRRLRRYRLPHAARSHRRCGTRHRHRPEGRDEHDQHQESSSPARSSPHLPNSISVPSAHLLIPPANWVQLHKFARPSRGNLNLLSS
jgi:hypothetical protein